MLPLGHVAFGYLLYAGYARVTRIRAPPQYSLVVLAFGTQFPDLVDKPLAYVEILVSGRSLAHSLFAFLIVSAGIWKVANYLKPKLEAGWRLQLCLWAPAAFVIGYGSHLVGDSYKALLAGNVHDVGFLVYPLYALQESPADDIAPWTRMVRIYRDMGTHPQLEFIALALAVFVGTRIWAFRRRIAPSRLGR